MNASTPTRPIHVIAADIRRTWPKVYYGARPYLAAMAQLEAVDQVYICEDARSILNYFLANATTWRGPDARRIKAELNGMVGR